MEFTIDQILLMQDTIIDVRRRTQELTIFEIVSREIDPVLFILLLTTEQFLSNGPMANCHVTVSYAVHNQLFKLVSASHPSHRFSLGLPVTPFPIGTGGGAWSDIRMDPS